MIEFDTPAALLLLIPLLIGCVIRWWSRPPAIAVSSVEHFTGKSAPARRLFAVRHLSLFLECAAATLLVIAIARPQKGIEVASESKAGSDIMIALDLSNSMDFYDPERGMSRTEARAAIKEGRLPPRLTVAKEKLIHFIRRRPDDRIGFVVFGSTSYTGCPPTLDHNFLRAQIELLSPNLFTRNERGTNIASGLTAAINTLLSESDARRTIVLITDGEHNVEDDISPAEAAQIAKQKGIVVHALAVGSDDPIVTYGPRNQSSFDTEVLKRIAKTAEGTFFRVKDSEGFEEVMNTIDRLEKNVEIQPSLTFRKELYFPFLMAAAIVLLVSIVTRHVVFLEIA